MTDGYLRSRTVFIISQCAWVCLCEAFMSERNKNEREEEFVIS